MEIEQKVYRMSRLLFVMSLIGTLFFMAMGVFAVGGGEPEIGIFLFVMGTPLLILTVWIGSRRIEVGPESIAKSSIFGRTEMKWDDITDAQFRAKPNVTGAWLMFGAIGAAIAASTSDPVASIVCSASTIWHTPSRGQHLELLYHLNNPGGGAPSFPTY